MRFRETQTNPCGVVRGGIVRGGIVRGGIVRGGIVRGGIVRGGIVRGGIVCGADTGGADKGRTPTAFYFKAQGRAAHPGWWRPFNTYPNGVLQSRC